MPTATVTLKRGRAKPIWHGHPWIYSEAVAAVAGQPGAGDVVEIADHEGRPIGRGFYSPGSQIRVRVVAAPVEDVDEALIVRRVEAAAALRRRLGLPAADTDAYRLVNSEGDRLPGLVVDVYGDAAVIQFTGIGMKAREAAVHAAVERAVRPRSLFEASPGAFAAIEGFSATPRRVGGEERTEVVAREAGLEFLVDPLGGQKTGLFLDQRENRRRVGTLASGARVLDVYTYVGGFALAAARGGAATVTAVDISPRALDRARANAARAGRPVEFVEADAFRYLETAAPRGFDLVILDPPKFARERKDLEAALRGYRRLNALALAACADGAILASATCSQLVGRSDFERILAGAALDARRRLQILEVSGAGPDHPLPPAFAEGSYLKFALCRVS